MSHGSTFLGMVFVQLGIDAVDAHFAAEQEGILQSVLAAPK